IGLKAVSSPVRRVFAAIPPRAWIAIGCSVAAFLGVWWHQHHAHAALKAADAAGYSRARQEDREAALDLKARIDALASSISDDERKLNDEANSHIVASAADLSLHGPGKAVCRSDTVLPSSPSGSQPASRPTDAAVAPVPEPARPELFGLPSDDAI